MFRDREGTRLRDRRGVVEGCGNIGVWHSYNNFFRRLAKRPTTLKFGWPYSRSGWPQK